MGSVSLFAFFLALASSGTVRCMCIRDSYVLIRGDTVANQTCNAVNSSLNKCITSPNWTQTGCNSQNCTLDLLMFVSCQAADNSSELAIQIKEDFRVFLTRTYVFTEWSSIVIEGQGESATVECTSNVGVVFQNVGSLVVRNTQWQNCGGSQIAVLDGIELSGALLILQTAQVYVVNSKFVESIGAGVVVKTRVLHGGSNRTYSYRFEDSTFSDSGNLSLPNSHAGGGVAVHVLQYIVESETVENETSVSIRFDNCSFFRNAAFSGGGAFVSAFNADGTVVELRMDVEFQMCTFIENSALTTGGAVTITGVELSEPNAVFNDCRFLHNDALLSGGAVHLGINAGLRNAYIGFSNCYWHSNGALEASALSITSIRPMFPVDILNITNCTMVSNNAGLMNYDARCTASLSGINKVVLNNEVNITDNVGSGLCLHRSVAVINGRVWISYNHRANTGGGIYLHRKSFITLTPGSVLTLDSNNAVYGGGLFVTQPSDGVCFLNSTGECANIIVSNNQAFFNGAAMYFQDPDQSCNAELKRMCEAGYQRTDINSPVKGNINLIFNSGATSLFPGQQIELEVNMKDFFGSSGKATVRANLHPHNAEYNLMGSAQFTLQDGINKPNLTVFGPEPIENNRTFSFEMAALDRESSNINQNISVQIVKCPLGYDSSPQYCMCSEGVECDNFTGTACVLKGDWFGNFPDNSSPSVLLTCSSGYCSNIGNCDPCTVEGDYCALSNPQCIQSRVGPMCLECPEGYSYTFGAIRCADNEYCQIPGLFTSLFIILYSILCFALLFILLKFAKGATLGALFSFMYYYSVIDVVLPPSIVNNNILSIVYVIQSVTDLNPKFLGLVPICVAENASILVLQYLLYISPVIVWALVIVLVLCSRRFSKHVKFNDRTPITVISLVILLTFTAFTKTSFNILLPIRFAQVNQTFVNIAPNTVYFASVDHQIFVIIAVTVLLFGVLPFTSFLFLVPFLSHYCNMTRIKPFLDEFQSCYKDEYRWMAGFYFICRIPYFLSQLFHLVVVEEYITQFLSLGVLLFHAMLQPYKMKRLNVTDTIILADIICLTLLYGNTAETVFQQVPSVIRDTVAFMLILLPVFILFLLFLIRLHHQHPVLKQWFSRPKHEKEPDSGSDTNLSVPYREPLLSMDESFDRVRLTNYERGNAMWDSEPNGHGYTNKSTRNSDGDKNRPNFTEISLAVLSEEILKQND